MTAFGERVAREEEEDRVAELDAEYGYTIVLPRDDVAAFMAAVAELEQYADSLSQFGRDERVLEPDADDAVTTLSRIASSIDEQVSTQ